VSPLKPAVDQALADRGRASGTVEHVLVVRRTENEVGWTEGRDIWWHDAVPAASAEHEAQAFPAENPLFILYTSGTTGKPKGILHTSGGYLTQAAFTNKVVHDLHPVRRVLVHRRHRLDHRALLRHVRPLANGATQVLYEGTPDAPHPGRWWELVQKYGVTVLYTAPTAIRSFMKLGRRSRSSSICPRSVCSARSASPSTPRRGCGTARSSAADAAPIVDTWWQTETGAIMVSALPGVTETKPGSAQAAPGIGVDVVDDDGNHVGNGNGGLLVLTKPWPSMLRGIWGDPERFVETYWEKFQDKGYYFAGDGARLDEDGDVWFLGRVDDVMNVSGHRLSTTEIESALVGNEAVAEAAVVGAPTRRPARRWSRS
jgi:acetyl-CoA synthetase